MHFSRRIRSASCVVFHDELVLEASIDVISLPTAKSFESIPHSRFSDATLPSSDDDDIAASTPKLKNF